MFQRPPSFSRNCISAPGPLGELEPAQPLVARVGSAPADHVPDVQLRHLVLGEVDRFVAAAGQQRGERGRVLARLGRDADEDVRLLASAQAIVELGHDPAADRRAEFAERAGPLGNGDGEQRFARFAELGALGDEAQAIEVHVRAAQHRDEPLVAHAVRAPPRSSSPPRPAPRPAPSPCGYRRRCP